ncbi:MAG: hypothetical protein ACLP3K_07675 [Candidatus Acidiferrales bacterium]
MEQDEGTAIHRAAIVIVHQISVVDSWRAPQTLGGGSPSATGPLVQVTGSLPRD